jgi:hypothetical protein
MVSIFTLKNIYLKDWEDFFKRNNVHNISARLKGDTTHARYQSVHKLITEELSKENGSFSTKQFDDYLFEQLYYSKNNYHFVSRFDNHNFTNESTMNDVNVFFEQHPELLLNKLLNDDERGTENVLCTTRIEVNNGKLIGINILVRITTIKTKRYPDVDMYSGILIDLVNNLIVFKFYLNYLDNIPKDPLTILTDLRKMVMGEGANGRKFEPLDLNIQSLNEKAARVAIFQLFEDLSFEAENILNGLTLPDTKEKIVSFLKNMKLTEITEDYIEQIKAVIYQEISSTINDSIFEKGWVFRFVFREGLTTRASSRTIDFSPIYGSKIYWHLKELIFKAGELYEGGFHWYLYGSSDIEQFVQVRIESKNDTIVLNYYNEIRSGRREKENFVLRKINEHLQ